MPELPQATGSEAIRAFEFAGFRHVRTRGSHYVLKREGHRNLIVVPVHGARPISKGTLRSLVKDADISIEQFIEYLKQ